MQKIKDFYDARLWTAGMVANAVVKGRITEAEYQDITGEAYTAPETQDVADITVEIKKSEWDSLQEQLQMQDATLNDLLFTILPEMEGL